MSELPTSLRNQLGKVIVKARSVAEAGANRALKSLAVGHHEHHGSMSLEERNLRVRLRAHGRQLGDVLDRQRGSQSIGRLTHEVAYEHWHRMLFARFLAENGLLIHPEHEVAMSVRDIEELALETGQDPHQLAAGFAQGSVPQIFRTGDPVLEVTLAPETRQKLETLLDSLPTEIFTADDSLGWTYQYWQAEKKDAVNASGKKIGADELPAVTQLFTEHYMVMFLYHNTLGAWHAGKVLAESSSIAESAQTEEELRQAVALKTNAGHSDWDYLRFVRESREGDEEDNPTGPWRPAAGTFDGWPKTAKELKVLDPCCGSGHFLVAGFKLLTKLRMLEEGLVLEDAVNAVLRDNLFGLELDPRCTQIAAFNVALAAWRWVGKPIELPALSIACSGLSIGSSKKDWLALAGDDERLLAGLSNLYDLFRQAPELGSLIDPKTLGDDMFVANFEELQPLLQEALAGGSADEEKIERAVAARGMARAAELLSSEYTLLITNVPFKEGKQLAQRIQEHLDRHYRPGKSNLATAFVLRLHEMLSVAGSLALVSPHEWLFLGSYSQLRKRLLTDRSWNLLADLGEHAFESGQAAGAFVCLSIISKPRPNDSQKYGALDALQKKKPGEKALAIREDEVTRVEQATQLKNPDCRVGLGEPSSLPLLSVSAGSYVGLQNGDTPRYVACAWEVGFGPTVWSPFQMPCQEVGDFLGRHGALRWESGQGALVASEESYIKGQEAWGKEGVAIRQTRSLPATRYLGDLYDQSSAAIIPADPNDLPAVWAYCSSSQFHDDVRLIDKKKNVTNATLVKVRWDPDYWSKVAEENYPDGLPEPYSEDPTQWLFHGHPAKAEQAAALQIAVARLLGYRWPPELDSQMRLADEAREWAARCEELLDLVDDDGIVCLPAIRSEPPAADRLRKLLAAAFGSEWSAAKERELLAAAAGDGKKPATSLEAWLRDKFFEEHCKLFHHRPFIWHIWDGSRDGFHCLVNAHRLTGPNGDGRRTLEAITYSYLRDWIQRQKDDQKTMVEGADARLAAALDLQMQLKNILEGEPPCDLFIRWKELHEQAIGWAPDIDDGVRLNIRPFMSAELRTGGRRGAGLLRWKPNIKWTKDRGKEPESLRPIEDFPWFWGCNGDGPTADRTNYTAERAGKAKFDGNRWNDLHYSRAVKEAARAAAKQRPQEADK